MRGQRLSWLVRVSLDLQWRSHARRGNDYFAQRLRGGVLRL
jgi:hypothetical protein